MLGTARSRILGLGLALLAPVTLAACGGAAQPKGTAAPGGTSAACAPGAAAPSDLITVAQESDSGVATINGPCWASIKPTPIVNSVIGTAPGNVSAWTKVAWSRKDLFVLCWVAQWPLPASGVKLWNSQTVEFYVSGNNDKSGDYGPQDGQFGITAGDPTLNKGTDKLNADPTPLTQVVQNKGYFAELVVPWSVLGVGAPAKGQKYKFDAAVDYGDDSGTQVAQTMWVGTQDNWKDTSNWGSIQLG